MSFTVNALTILDLWILMAGIALLLLISNLLLWIKNRSLYKRYQRLTDGVDQGNMEELMMDFQNRLKQIADRQSMHGSAIDQLNKQMVTMKGRVGIIRYNAFGDRGSDLSFSVAIVDQERNGAVISGLHSRDETYIYAKPLQAGSSKYTLTPEEKQAIDAALGSDQ